MRLPLFATPLALLALGGCEQFATRTPSPVPAPIETPPVVAAPIAPTANGTLSLLVLTAEREPAVGALVMLHGPRDPAAAPRPPTRLVLQLFDERLLPSVSAVPVGATVVFRNSSELAHEIYSFSSARQFAVRVAPHAAPAEVTFGKPGLVVLGCKLHGETIAYLQVTDAVRSATADRDGYLRLADLMPGRYRVQAWLPGERDRPARQDEQSVTVPNSADGLFRLTVRANPPRNP